MKRVEIACFVPLDRLQGCAGPRTITFCSLLLCGSVFVCVCVWLAGRAEHENSKCNNSNVFFVIFFFFAQ